MKTIFTLTALFLTLTLYAQELTRAFVATDLADNTVTVDSVVAINLTTTDAVSLKGNETLILRSSTTSVQETSTDNLIRLYPNPYMGSARLELPVEKEQKVVIRLSSVSGKTLTLFEKTLTPANYGFNVSAGKSGLYILSVSTNSGTHSIKMIQTGNGTANIEQVTQEMAVHGSPNTLKAAATVPELTYSDGDTILYKFFNKQYSYIDTTKEALTSTSGIEVQIAGRFKTCFDIDGNWYRIVKISNQIWMAENLKVTHYPNGDAIPQVSDDNGNGTTDDEWGALADNNISDAYCYYNDDMNNFNIYGALYTFAAAIADDWQRDNDTNDNQSGQGVCPDGWHLPAKAEWTELVTNLGGIETAGAKMKETGTTHWKSPNEGATNSSGFTGLPGALRYEDGKFDRLNEVGIWWSSSEYSRNNHDSWCRTLYYANTKAGEWAHYKSKGFSVRCVK